MTAQNSIVSNGTGFSVSAKYEMNVLKLKQADAIKKESIKIAKLKQKTEAKEKKQLLEKTAMIKA